MHFWRVSWSWSLDGVLIGNECVNDRQKLGRKRISGSWIYKDYDHVNWEFLDYVFRRMGFVEKCRSWMRSCVSSISFFLMLINGSSKGFFQSFVGLRQGYRLSTCVSWWQRHWVGWFNEQKMVSFGLWGRKGWFTHSSPSVCVWHEIFCKVTVRKVGVLRCILRCFEVLSGLKINLSKSEIF